jgi:hypothetical protein
MTPLGTTPAASRRSSARRVQPRAYRRAERETSLVSAPLAPAVAPSFVAMVATAPCIGAPKWSSHKRDTSHTTNLARGSVRRRVRGCDALCASQARTRRAHCTRTSASALPSANKSPSIPPRFALDRGEGSACAVRKRKNVALSRSATASGRVPVSTSPGLRNSIANRPLRGRPMGRVSGAAAGKRAERQG